MHHEIAISTMVTVAFKKIIMRTGKYKFPKWVHLEIEDREYPKPEILMIFLSSTMWVCSVQFYAQQLSIPALWSENYFKVRIVSRSSPIAVPSDIRSLQNHCISSGISNRDGSFVLVISCRSFCDALIFANSLSKALNNLLYQRDSWKNEVVIFV